MNLQDFCKKGVTVLGRHGEEIRLGIEAPKNITVHRQEVYERIRIEKETADG